MFIKIPENGVIHKVTILGLGHTIGDEAGFKKVTQSDFIRDIISDEARKALFGHKPPFSSEEIDEAAKKWEEKTGVGDRLFFHNETWKMGYYAALMCLNQAGVKVTDLDAIFTGTNTPGDKGYPSPADKILKALEDLDGHKSNAFCMNVQEACTTSAHAIFVAYGLIRAGLCKKILVILPENCNLLTKPDKWKEGANLFGAGAGAILLSVSDDVESFLFFDITADGSKDNLTAIHSDKNNDYDFSQRGPDVLKYVAGAMPKALMRCFSDAGINPENVSCLIAHQPSGRLMYTFKDNIKNRWPEFKGIIPEETGVGNISSASTIVLFSKLVRSGVIKAGDIISLAPFGAGLSGACVGIVVPEFNNLKS